jgi:hypothetical protein
VIANEPTRRFTMFNAPGWHGEAVLSSLRQYGGRLCWTPMPVPMSRG